MFSKNISFLIGILLITLYSQCGLVQLSSLITSTPGFYSGYKELNKEQKQSVISQKDGTLCSLKNDDKIHVIRAQQLLNCLKENDKSLVYTWSPHCSSRACILVSACQDYCNKKGLELYVIADYYAWDVMQGQNVAKRPIFTIDHQYYKANYALKYKRLFLDELAPENPLVGKKKFGMFLFFEKDKLVESRDKLF